MFKHSLAMSLLSITACSTTPAPMPDVVAGFQAQLGQLPEGLAISRDSEYVGFAPAAAIAQVDSAGTVSTYATLPSTSGGKNGYLLGLLFDGAGQLYAGQASFGDSVMPGIYRVPVGGGTVTTPWASDPAMTFPNGLAFAADGSLFVADSTGYVFRIEAAGNVTTWSHDSLLVGNPTACPNLLSVPIGANGIVVTNTDAWVTNTDYGRLIRIPINADGTAGTAIAVIDECGFAGADGLALDSDGTFVVAINGQDKLVRANPSGTFETILAGPPLDFPASVTLERGETWVTAAAFITAQTTGDSPAPALVNIH